MAHTVLLTGATGFLGGHAVSALAHAGHQLILLARANSDTRGVLARCPEAVVVDGDSVPLSEILSRHAVETIVHLACDQGRSGDLEALVHTNVVLGMNLLQAARDAGVARFLNADTQLDASVNPYARSKKVFAGYLPDFAGDMAIVNMRFGNIYGPGESARGFLSWLLGEFERGVPTIDFTPGEQQRDFVHAADASGAMLAILDHAVAVSPAADVQSYDIGSGRLQSLRSFVELAQAVYRQEAGAQGSALNFGGLPYREGEIMLPDFDTTALFGLGWRPRFTLEEGLRDTIKSRRSAG